MDNEEFNEQWQSLDDREKVVAVENLLVTWQDAIENAVNIGLIVEIQHDIPEMHNVLKSITLLLERQIAIYGDNHPNLWGINKSAVHKKLGLYTTAYVTIEDMEAFIFLRSKRGENYRFDEFDLVLTKNIVFKMAESLSHVACLKYNDPSFNLTFPAAMDAGFKFNSDFLVLSEDDYV